MIIISCACQPSWTPGQLGIARIETSEKWVDSEEPTVNTEIRDGDWVFIG